MTPGPHDPRSICNAMLDISTGRVVTNLALQKLLYFAHGLYLVESGAPLVSGYFEAWKYGPVHPSAYAAFKMAGDQPISFRAVGIDPLTGGTRLIASLADEHALRIVDRVMASFGQMTAGRLVEISHAPKAPWAAVVAQGKLGVSFGMRIPDSVILERFKQHKVTVGTAPVVGEPGEDSPIYS